jgi:hypothetical protein
MGEKGGSDGGGWKMDGVEVEVEGRKSCRRPSISCVSDVTNVTVIVPGCGEEKGGK